jgi:hypothetical protein
MPRQRFAAHPSAYHRRRIPPKTRGVAHGDTDKDAVAHVTELAGERVRAAVDDGQPVPQRRHFSEMPSHIRTKQVGRTIIPVEVGRREAWPLRPITCPPKRRRRANSSGLPL